MDVTLVSTLAKAELPQCGSHEPALLLPLLAHTVYYPKVEGPPELFHIASQFLVLAPCVGVVPPEHLSDKLMVSCELICLLKMFVQSVEI